MIKKESIQKIIHEEGFDLSGVISPGQVDGYEEFVEWLGENRHADMEWLKKDLEKRKNTANILEGCRSIIVLGVSYFNSNYQLNEINNEERALIARYAWGDDYHEVLKVKLKNIIGKIEKLNPRVAGAISWKGDRQGRPYDIQGACSNPEFKFYTDTGPILEKNIAEMAGLGWKGRNSLLINHKIGSYFFIATIFTTLEIEKYQEKIIGSCGSCRKCIDACPTGAILENKSIDCRKCISYHTIENKGEIPPEIKNKISNRIFGCDICQEVCPWNRFAKKTRMPELKIKNNRNKLTIKQIKNMDREEYQRLFKNSAVKRAKFEGLRRNAERN
jgi:epoxyqueuosine reductase